LIVDKRFADAIEQANDANGFYFGHGTTYSGHPVGCAIALAVLNIFERDKLLEHVRQVAKRFAQRLAQLREHPQVAHARADGLMGAVELHGVRGRDLSKEVRLAAEARHGLIFRAVANNVCAFSPPLIITESEVDELFDRFTSALDEVSRGSRIPDPA
jgi:4-aminobutyrate--pyruvate transaminase